MSRSKWKGPYIDYILLSKILNKKNQSDVILTKSRNSVILPNCVGINFKIYNGKSFYSFKVTKNMIGYKFGEFAPTRKQFSTYQKKKTVLVNRTLLLDHKLGNLMDDLIIKTLKYFL